MKALIFIVLLMLAPLWANEADALFQKGVQAYQNEEFETAVELFENVLQTGRESAAVYYNLGNAYYKLDNIGKAILNYERAKRLDSGDEDIEFNLKIARLQVVDKIPSPEMDYFYKLWQKITFGPSLQFLTVFTLAAYILFFLLMIIKMFVRRAGIRNMINFSLVPLLVVLLLSASLFIYRVRYDIKSQFGIILASRVTVTSSPAEDATEVFALHEGVKVKVIAQSGDFIRIRLSDGKDGWVKSRALEII